MTSSATSLYCSRGVVRLMAASRFWCRSSAVAGNNPTLVYQVVNEGDADLELFVLQIVPFGAPRLILESGP